MERDLDRTLARALAVLLVSGLAVASGACKGPDTTVRQLPLRIDEQRLAVEWQDGPRRDAAEAEMRREAKRIASALFRGEPMPTGAPTLAKASAAAAAPEVVGELPEPGRPEWADGVARPPTVLEHDLPRAWPVEVRRGETPALLARWAGTDARTIFSDNEETLKKRRWLKTGDRLMVTMSANQKVAFDNARDAFAQDRLDAYFAKRYFEKVVVYRVKRGEYLANAAKRYGDVPLWLLEEFNQMDFRTLQPGDEVLIPVVVQLKPGQKAPPMLVVDEELRPLGEARKDALAQRLRNDIMGKARMALDDSNVFERGGAIGGDAGGGLLPDFADVRAADLGAPIPEGQVASERPPAPVVAREIIVKPGETLMHFVRWSGTTLDAIRAANPQLDPDRIMSGARITLPLDDGQYVDLVKARAAWAKAGGARGEAAARAPEPAPKAKPRRAHQVVAGETAHRIAKRYDTNLRGLREANPGVDLVRLRIGQRLYLP